MTAWSHWPVRSEDPGLRRIQWPSSSGLVRATPTEPQRLTVSRPWPSACGEPCGWREDRGQELRAPPRSPGGINDNGQGTPLGERQDQGLRPPHLGHHMPRGAAGASPRSGGRIQVPLPRGEIRVKQQGCFQRVLVGLLGLTLSRGVWAASPTEGVLTSSPS